MTNGLGKKAIQEVIETMGDPVILLSSKGAVVHMNSAAEKIAGFKENEVIGQHIMALGCATDNIPKNTKKAIRRFNAAVKKGEFFEEEYEIPSKSGEMIPVALTASILKDEKEKTRFIIASFREITKYISERKKTELEIGKRVKEFACLLGTSELATDPNLDIDRFLQKVVDLLPPAWSYPEITCGRITVSNREFTTSNFGETLWKQAANIKVSGKQEGTIEVYYLEERPDIDEGPFLKAERNLIDGLAKQIGNTIERRRAEKALKEAERELVLRDRISHVFLTVTEDEVMYDEILNITLETLDSEFGVFGYIDKDGAFVVPSMTRHIWDQCKVTDKSFTFPRNTWGDSTWPKAIREKRTICLNEPSTLTPEGHIAISRHISLPIIHHGVVIGLFQVANKRTEYDESDIQKLERIAQDVAPNLGARLHRNKKEEERKKLEDKLIQSERLAVLGQLSGGIGHELRNPLAAINSAVYFLRMAIENPDQNILETLEILEMEVSTSERIIKSLLDFARPKSPTRRKVQVNDLVDAAISRIKVPDGIEVVYRLELELPIILADPIQIDQIATNIILNAVQAMPHGGQLTITTQEADSGWIAMAFSDTGVGITEEHLHRLYEPLFTTKAKGIGLGLAIIKMMVESHDGSIEVQSEVGKGTTFIVKLPGSLGKGVPV